jgi:hypothetical protein
VYDVREGAVDGVRMSPKTIYMAWILGFVVAVVALAGVLLMLNRVHASKSASNFGIPNGTVHIMLC